MSGLSELIAKLEGLSGRDREVDADIYVAFFIPQERVGRIDRLGGCVGWWPKDAPYESAIDVPPYTASLDAAVALVERKLPGTDWQVSNGNEDGCAAHIEGDDKFYAGPTPAIAVCLALLRSLEGRDE